MDNTSIAKELCSSLKEANKRLFCVVLILILALILTNGGWIWYNMQWEYTTETIEVDTQNSGGNAVLNTGEGGVNYNGENPNSKTEENKETKEDKIQLIKPDE